MAMMCTFYTVSFIDINECKIAEGICGPGRCINTPGSFRCECQPGYRNSMMMEMCMGKC